jgi:hypothetical protein
LATTAVLERSGIPGRRIPEQFTTAAVAIRSGMRAVDA